MLPRVIVRKWRLSRSASEAAILLAKLISQAPITKDTLHQSRWSFSPDATKSEFNYVKNASSSAYNLISIPANINKTRIPNRKPACHASKDESAAMFQSLIDHFSAEKFGATSVLCPAFRLQKWKKRHYKKRVCFREKKRYSNIRERVPLWKVNPREKDRWTSSAKKPIFGTRCAAWERLEH